ncbi:hypothetical protein ACW0JT_09360 [Arthrobacter sp. SA17]
MTTSSERERVLELQDLIISSESVAEFLGHLSALAAATLSRESGSTVEVGVTLKRRRRTDTVAGSSEHAIKLDRIEQQMGDGPCIQALRVKSTVLLGMSAAIPAGLTTRRSWRKWAATALWACHWRSAMILQRP